MRIIAVTNQKGGVGKTTTVFNLGFALSNNKRRVLLLDLDPQANLTSWADLDYPDLSITEVFTQRIPLGRVIVSGGQGNPDIAPVSRELSGIDIVYADKSDREQRIKRAIEPVADHYDYILIDCPPSLGLLSINALVAGNEVFIPIQTKIMSLSGLVDLIEVISLIRDSYNPGLSITGIIPCMYDCRTNLSKEVLQELRSADITKDKVFKTIIRENVRLAEAPSFKKSIFDYAPNSYGAQDYTRLAKEVIKQKRGIHD